jgi:hypothetical protein
MLNPVFLREPGNMEYDQAVKSPRDLILLLQRNGEPAAHIDSEGVAAIVAGLGSQEETRAAVGMVGEVDRSGAPHG